MMTTSNNAQAGQGDRSNIPYGSAGTFTTTLDHFGAVGLPNIIDRNAMPPSFSGSSTYETLHTFKHFKLIGEDGKPNVAALTRLVNPETRKDASLELIHAFYPSLLALPLATAGPTEVNKWFSENASPSTAKKAKAFFLALARQCNVPLHPLVGQAARVPVGGIKRKRRKNARGAWTEVSAETNIVNTSSAQARGQSASGGSSKTVTLKSGGEVTLAVTIDPMELSDEDQEWVFGLIKQLRAYEKEAQAGT